MAGMTKRTIDNFQVADAAHVYPSCGKWLLALAFKGNVSYVSSTKGLIEYASAAAASRVVGRVRPDLTVIVKGGE